MAIIIKRSVTVIVYFWIALLVLLPFRDQFPQMQLVILIELRILTLIGCQSLYSLLLLSSQLSVKLRAETRHFQNVFYLFDHFNLLEAVFVSLLVH